MYIYGYNKRFGETSQDLLDSMNTLDPLWVLLEKLLYPEILVDYLDKWNVHTSDSSIKFKEFNLQMSYTGFGTSCHL